MYSICVELSDDSQSKHGPDIHPIDHWVVGLPLIHPPLIHDYMAV